MKNSFDYLIVGGGMAADAAAKGIRSQDKEGRIGIVCEEPVGPYRRPALSKQLWTGAPENALWLNTEKTGAELLLNKRAVQIDRISKRVLDNQGNEYEYNKLLLATGVETRRLPFGGDDIIYFRNLDDYKKLRAKCREGSKIVIIGGGFTGSELAAALAGIGAHVTMIFPEENLGARVFPIDLSCFLSDYYRSKQVEILSDDVPVSLEKTGEQYIVRTQNGKEIIADGVVASIGMIPSCDLAASGGLKCDNGIVVNQFLQTSDPDIYSAGDITNFYSESLEIRMRCEHVDSAINMGKCAGKAMAGLQEPYEYLAFAYADMFEMGYRSIGQVDSRMDVHPEWKDFCKEGIIYYRDNGKVKGILFWNQKMELNKARNVMSNKQPITNEELQELFK